MKRTPTYLLRYLLFAALLLPQFSASALTCKNGPVVTLNGGAEAELAADFFVLNDRSCCSFGLSYGISLDNGATYQPSATFNCDDLGQAPVKIKFTDCLGLPNYCQTFVIVQANTGICDTGCGGCCFPTIKAKPLTVALSDDYAVELHAAWFDDGSTSECATGALQFSFSQAPNDNLKTLTCDEIGSYPIQLWVTDAAGTKAFGETFVIVQLPFGDCTGTGPCLPAPVTLNGMTVRTRPDGKACIIAREFDVASHAGSCGGTTSFRLSFSSNPNDTLACFDCTELQQQPVRVYVHDDLGNSNYIETFVVVQDLSNFCVSTANLVPPNDDVCNAYAIDHLLNSGCTEYFFNINADAGTNEVTPPLGACGVPNTWCDTAAVAEKTVWFKFNAPATHQIEITTTGMNTQLALWTAESCGVLKAGFATLLAANDDDPALPGGGSRLVAECLVAGKDYYLQMDGHSNKEGVFGLRYSAAGPACTSSAAAEKLAAAHFTVAPNPASGHANVFVERHADWIGGLAVVSDLAGRAVVAQTVEGASLRLDLGHLAPGIYFLYLKNGGLATPVQKLAILK